MVPRPAGGRLKTLAVVNPARCVGCGICVGACDTGGILLGGEPVHVLAAAVTARVGAARARDPQAPPVLAFTCRLLARLAGRLDADGLLTGVPGVAVLGLPCVGLLHPDTIGRALSAGAAGVFVAGCVPEDCQFREGSAWLVDRLAGRRLPAARRLPAGRVRLRFYAPVEAARFVADVRAFAASLPSSEGGAVIAAPPHRRPGPARLVVFGLVLLAVSWGLATFSAWPWTAAPPEAATLRISVKAVTALTAPAVPRADVGDLPVHMRPLDPARPTTGRRGDAVLTVAVDGVRVLERTYRPTGLRRDGPVYGYEEIPVAPGRHVVQATLTDLTAEPGAPVSSSTAIEVTVAPGDAPLLEFRDGAWRWE
jgi:coenzyme F420-reducing hydrogenase delta subunit